MKNNFNYGGQAVIEGVMMRGGKAVVTAVRRPNGELTMDTQSLAPIYTGRLRKVPLLRGIIILVEALILGIKSLLYSADVSLEEEHGKISGWLVWVLITVSLGVAVLLFFMAPLFLTKLINVNSPLLFNLIDGLIRLVIFITYLKLLTLLPDIRRVFAYHGAEHKTINAYEDGVPLEVKAVKQYSTAHVRCGTSFLFTVLIIAIFVFAIVGLPALWMMVLSRIIFIPVIAAISYEVIFFTAKFKNSGIVKVIMFPGLFLQSLTTRDPDDSQIEVALLALRKVIEIDNVERET
jgi:uncharacterized protein YqhQ